MHRGVYFSDFHPMKVGTVGFMTAKRCPRCDAEIALVDGRGRPRKWCSVECRRRSSEERRAARSSGRLVEVREEVRERVVERSRPLSPDGAVDRVLSDTHATQRLLRVLAHRLRADPALVDLGAQSVEPLIAELWQACHGTRADDPTPMPPTGTAPSNRAEEHRQAVALVLDSPRSTREVLNAVAAQARAGELAGGEHSGTIAAANTLIDALIVSRSLRR
ncbi:hypothetical protein [Nocardia brasiliensis]|uniref:hypothetical protein n=1 Tax=Nocardia brasiliensis TaxID=37326 RepID=UPI0018950FEE|nr:hypothetical protein [Nocardia brasiliensis]MBF6548853.1 hypothetical protein [Nocardia brasiliensis]